MDDTKLRLMIVDIDSAHKAVQYGAELVGKTEVPTKIGIGYLFHHEVAREIQTHATPRLVDLLIIGNNNGLGIQYADVVHPIMYPQTVICYHTPLNTKHKEAYMALGIIDFCTRDRLAEYLSRRFNRVVKPKRSA